MNLSEAQIWISTHAVIEQGYYLDGDAGQPDPSTVYCRKHAAVMATRYTRQTKKRHVFCEAGMGSDLVEWCGVKSCGVTLTTGGLNDDGIKWALGIEEENPLSFVASINELELAQRSMTGPNSTRESQHLWQLWLSQVLRNQRGVTKTQCLAFEAAWMADHWDFALDILRRRDTTRVRKPRRIKKAT